MKYVISGFVITILLSCFKQTKTTKLHLTAWQKQMNAKFKDASKTPLKQKDLKHFKTLNFYPFDSAYVVKAGIQLTPNTPFVEMKTTTSRMSYKRIYGILNFKLNGSSHQLNVYQDKDLMAIKGYEDYLFLPFLDDTNGETTYVAGRYIELRFPQGDSLVVNFNEAFNPYCVYNKKYSCPIVPFENTLNTKVEAGVKDFKKEIK